VTEQRTDVQLDLRSGGWAIILGLVLAGGAMALMLSRGHRGSAAAAFDLSTCLVPREDIVTATSPEALPPMIDPVLIGPDEAEATRLPQHGKFLRPNDRVIGVAIDGEACAYPIRVMNWHEVVDHTVGGVPIAVTWAALSESPRVLDRRVGDETLVLAASGRVVDSCPLLFDRRPEGHPRKSSLWSALEARAVAGPAAAEARTLKVVPCELTSWADWRAAHPKTRVIGPDLTRADRYRKDPYHAYTGTNILRFPVAPLPPREVPLGPKALVVVVGPPGKRVVYPLPWLHGKPSPFVAEQEGVRVEVHHADDPPRARVVLPEGCAFDVVQCSWFAWYAAFEQDAKLADGLRP
jgi:hypothetical protein